MAATRYPIHVCLVSEQATPNFIPALDSRTRPREVVLVVSPDMRERARWLRGAFEARGIVVSEHPIADAWDIAGVQEALLELLVQRDSEELALNVTGGTKPMAIAAQEVFRSECKPIFYAHPEQNQILPIYGPGERLAIEERVRLTEYLAIHGYREVGRDAREFPGAYYDLCAELVKEVERFSEPLRRLNYLSAEAKATLRVNMQQWSRNERIREVVDKLDRYGVATIDGDQLRFPSETARFFANGGWLELHVARVLESLRSDLGVQDFARSLRVQAPSGARNEIDVAFLALNRLYLVECKARRMAGDEEDGPGAETLYKLDSLTAMGGLNTRGMLVSYQAIEASDRRRARELRIELVERGELRNLDQHLNKWIKPRS